MPDPAKRLGQSRLTESELAQRKNIAMATLDGALIKAAENAGVSVLRT